MQLELESAVEAAQEIMRQSLRAALETGIDISWRNYIKSQGRDTSYLADIVSYTNLYPPQVEGLPVPRWKK